MKALLRGMLTTHGITVAASVLILVIGILFLRTLEGQVEAESRDELHERTVNVARTFERQLLRSLSTTLTVATILRRSGGDFSDFEVIAAETLTQAVGVRTMRLAPDGIVRAVFPAGGNAGALGHNVLVESQWSDPVRRSIESHTLGIVGPIQNADGHYVVSGVLPIYIRHPGAQQETLWGVVIADVDLQEVLDAMGLHEALGRRIRDTLVIEDPITGRTRMMIGNYPDIPDPVAVPLLLPGAKWTLISFPEEGWGTIYKHGETYIMLGLLMFLSAMVFFLAIQRSRLAAMASHDGLTGLPNRRLFYERARLALAQARRSEKLVAFMFVDVNNFKSINDNFGHAVGDIVLQQVASRLRGHVRETDSIARFAGDEFLLLLTNISSRDEVQIVVDKLHHAMKEPIYAGENVLDVRVTVGVSFFPDDGSEIDELLKKADATMYSSKHRAKRHAAI